MTRPARHFITVACCLVLAVAFTGPALLPAMIMPPPPPLEPGSAVPAPSATPSDPEGNETESKEPSDTEAVEDSQESDGAGELSPSPSPSPSATPSS